MKGKREWGRVPAMKGRCLMDFKWFGHIVVRFVLCSLYVSLCFADSTEEGIGVYRTAVSSANLMGHVAAEHRSLVVAHLHHTCKSSMKGYIKSKSIRWSPRAGGLECQLVLKFRLTDEAHIAGLPAIFHRY